MISVENHTLRK